MQIKKQKYNKLLIIRLLVSKVIQNNIIQIFE